MQENALAELYGLEYKVKSTNDRDIIIDWRKLQASDHFYYMCTKYFADGDVHKYFNPYDSPYDAYINFMTVLDDLNSRCCKALLQKEREPFRILGDETLQRLKKKNAHRQVFVRKRIRL